MRSPRPNLAPNDLCGCDSGRTYRDCHQAVLEAPKGKAIAIGQAMYAKEWAANADAYQAQGLYAALAADLIRTGPVHRLLDIGCGLGQGVAALQAVMPLPDRLIVGLDENPDCLDKAAIALAVPAEGRANRRTRATQQLSGAYDIKADGKTVRPQGDTVLVQADLMIKDQTLESWLDLVGPFDAVTFWFSGVHKGRQLTKVAQRLGANGDTALRAALERRTFEIARHHLRSEGRLQIVMRAAGNADGRRDEWRDHAQAWGDQEGFDLIDASIHVYTEPTVPGVIAVKSVTEDLEGQPTLALSAIFTPKLVSTREATDGLFKLANRPLFNIAPERANELAEQVLESSDWSILPCDGSANFYAIVSDRSIHTSWAGMASLWCLAHAVYCMIHLGSSAARNPRTEGQKLDFGEAWAALDLGDYVAFAEALCRADEPWPNHLRRPDTTVSGESVEGRINNLFFGALSWILLHEVGHVTKGHQHLATADQRVRQEFEADGFATDWILKKAGAGLQREFRVQMILTALAWLFLFERVKGQGKTHPPAIYRFREVRGRLNLGERSAALENGAYMFKAMFDPANLDMPSGMTPRQAFDWMADRMEALFPAQ